MAIVRVVREHVERGCEGRSSRKSRVEVVEGEFPHIGARGCRIISFGLICHVTEKYIQLNKHIFRSGFEHPPSVLFGLQLGWVIGLSPQFRRQHGDISTERASTR